MQNKNFSKSLFRLLLILEIVFLNINQTRIICKVKKLWYILKNKGIQNRPLTHPMLKTLYFRVKSIYCYKWLSVREVGRKQTIGYISYIIVWKFMKQYVMIYSIKSFLKINKDSTNKHFTIYCLFNIFSMANYCMCSRKILSIKRNIKKCTDFSSRAGWARKIMRFIKKAFRKKMMRFLAD